MNSHLPTENNSFFRSLLDLLYPPRCQVCHRFSPEPFCPECRNSVVLVQPPFCRSCGAPFDPLAKGPQECADCRTLRRSPIAWARAAGIYQGSLQRAILELKFAGRRSLARPLAALLAELAQSDRCESRAFDAVCPVPLHPLRRKERGFNQSELIARFFCQQVGLTLDTGLLQRTRPTVPQVMLAPEQRRRNVRGAFALSPQAEVTGKRLLLVDDVFTTGSTLRECAKVLRRAGAAQVCVLTVARPRPAWMLPPKE